MVTSVVVGSLNTDIVGSGLRRFPGPGEHVYGQELLIGPGGKSRNIADMMARLGPEGSVAMVGRTVRDPYGL
jgi:sugar/nucleoside kinase (ribokinase family)